MFGFATEEYSFDEDVGVGSLSVALLEGDLGDLDLTLFVDTEDDNVNATAEGNNTVCCYVVVIVAIVSVATMQ